MRERVFTFPSVDIALMTGRVKIKAVTSHPGSVADTLGYLGCLGETKAGQWHFLAWQSCKLPDRPMAPARITRVWHGILVTGEVRNEGPQGTCRRRDADPGDLKAGGLGPWVMEAK